MAVRVIEEPALASVEFFHESTIWVESFAGWLLNVLKVSRVLSKNESRKALLFSSHSGTVSSYFPNRYYEGHRLIRKLRLPHMSGRWAYICWAIKASQSCANIVAISLAGYKLRFGLNDV